jgi:hypothetical protein
MKEYINKKTGAKASELHCGSGGKKWYSVKNGVDSFTIPDYIVEGSCDWEEYQNDDDFIWTTRRGEKIRYKDMTHQHWSNIYYKAIGSMNTAIAQLAIDQLLKRFGGVILHPKEYVPICITTQDGLVITDPNKQLFTYNKDCGYRNSVLAKNVNRIDKKEILFSNEAAREEYIMRNSRQLSLEDLELLRSGIYYDTHTYHISKTSVYNLVKRRYKKS